MEGLQIQRWKLGSASRIEANDSGDFVKFEVAEKFHTIAQEKVGEVVKLTAERDELRASLGVLLDQVDYTAGACSLTTMVGAALPSAVIDKARAALSPS